MLKQSLIIIIWHHCHKPNSISVVLLLHMSTPEGDVTTPHYDCITGMQIDQVDDFGLRVYNTVKRHRILPVDISLSSGSLLITVGKDAQQPPYRIENRYPVSACEPISIKASPGYKSFQSAYDFELWLECCHSLPLQPCHQE